MTSESCRILHPHTLRVIVDTREKCPILFPAMFELVTCPDRIIPIPVTTGRRALTAGDYTLEIDGVSYADIVCAERKGSVQELAKNLLDPTDSARQSRSLSRLSTSCRHPTLLVEIPLHDLFSTRFTLYPPLLIHRLLVTSRLHHLDLLWVPKPTSLQSRRLLGTFLLHHFWACISHPPIPNNSVIVNPVIP